MKTPRFTNSLRSKNKRAVTLAAKKTVNYKGGTISVFWNDDGEDAEIDIFDTIGSDPWEGGGFTEKDMRSAMADIPKNKKLHIKLNSRGGDVYEGFGIKNAISEWPQKVTCTITGVAASTASWMVLDADEIRAGKATQVFIHDAMSLCYGNADEMREDANDLDTTSNQIAEIYADKTGKSVEEMRSQMKAKTLMTGQQAKDFGLIDTITDDAAQYNFSADDLVKMKRKLAALNLMPANRQPETPASKENTIVMNRTEMIALAKGWGITVENNITDEALKKLVTDGPPKAAPAPAPAPQNVTDPKIIDLENKVKELTTSNTEAKRQRLTGDVNRLISENKVPEALQKETLEDLMRDETRLASFYDRLPPKMPGAPPLGGSPATEITGESLKDISNFVAQNTHGFRDQFVGKNADKYLGLDEGDRKKVRNEMAVNSKRAARVIVDPKNRAKIISAWNTNTIDAGLQRNVVFTDFIEEFANVLLPLTCFSKTYSNVPLEGTDEVEVPFYDKSGELPKDWDPAVGYAANQMGNTTTAVKKIKIGGDGGAAPAGYARGRKFIGLRFSSYELRRQPYVNWEQHAKLQANALATGLVKDIISRVITAANYGAPVKIVAAPQFSADDVADLSETATGLNWPTFGRWLIVDHRYNTPLIKDPAFKQYLAYGSTDPIRMAMIKAAYGFENILIVPNLANYSPAGENLQGWINHLFGALIATAPIMPTDDVLQLLTRYDLIAHPNIDLVLEHRQMGDVVLDATTKVVECNYGGAPGRASSIKRIASQ